MESKHTPGPWKCKAISSYILNHNRGFMISGFETAQSIRDVLLNEIEANANLIAAAPDLLQAIKDGVELIEYLINATPTGKVRDTMCDWNIIAKQAINKALDL